MANRNGGIHIHTIHEVPAHDSTQVPLKLYSGQFPLGQEESCPIIRLIGAASYHPSTPTRNWHPTAVYVMEESRYEYESRGSSL